MDNAPMVFQSSNKDEELPFQAKPKPSVSTQKPQSEQVNYPTRRKEITRAVAIFVGLSKFWAKAVCRLVVLSACLGFVSEESAVAFQAIVYVDAANGSDTNPGSFYAPFRTIQRAQQSVRGINANMTNDIIVYLRGGIYHLTNSLSFNQSDSGSGGHTVFYSAYAAESAVLDGGTAVTGTWTSIGGGLYKTYVAGIQCRQLYVNGVRAIRARWPNAGLLSRISGWDLTNQLINLPAPNLPNFVSNTNNPVEIVLHLQWTAWRGRIASTSSDGTNCTVRMLNPELTTMFNQPNPGKDSDAPYFLENSLAFLDQPGEWYLDTEAGELYYFPRPTENMSTALVVAAGLSNLVTIAGSGLASPVHDLVFSNLIFQSTGWLGPKTFGHVDGQANQINTSFLTYSQSTQYHTPAAVMLSVAHNTVVSGCTFQNLGGVGIDLGPGCQTNVINANLFQAISDNAINDAVPAIAAATTNDLRSVNCFNVLANNFITAIGLDYEGAPGVFIGYAHDETVNNNEIYNVPSFGISIGWGWTYNPTVLSNNVVRNNHIIHYESSYDDGGGIYSLSRQPGTIIQSNYLQDAWYGLYAKPGFPITPVYLDQGSSNIVVWDNVWSNTVGPFVNWGNSNWPGAVTFQESLGNMFINNDSQDVNIITNAGILPPYQTKRPWPVPNHAPGNYQGVLNLGFAYAPGWSIYYTTNGSTPTPRSALYSGPIRLQQTLPISAVAVSPGGSWSGVFQGFYRQVSQVVELMPTNSWHVIVVGHQEQVGQADDTGFPWGGYTPKPGNGTIESTLDPGCRLYFFDGGTNDTMDTPGAYVYTLFSANGNGLATTNVQGMNQGGTISVTVNNSSPDGSFGGPLGLRFLIRDRTNNWYISAVSNALMIPGPGTFSADTTILGWQGINTSAQTSLNGAYAGRTSSGPGLISPMPNAATPDLSLVTGGGVFVSKAPGVPQEWWLNMVCWQGNNNVPPFIQTPVAASPNPVTTTHTGLSVLGGDSEGESNLSYEWTINSTSPPVIFSLNGNNAAKNTEAIFSQAGNYFVQVIITNQSGLSTTNGVTVMVVLAPSSLVASPPVAIVAMNGSLSLTGLVMDQFGMAMTNFTALTWSLQSGGGAITPDGFFVAPATNSTSVVQVVGYLLTNYVAIKTVTSLSSAASLWLPFNGNLADLGLSADAPHALITSNVGGGTYNGSFVSDVANTTCGLGSLSLTGAGSYVQAANASDLDFNTGRPFTIASWIKTFAGGTLWAYATTDIVGGQTGTHTIACFVGAGSLVDGEPLGSVVVDRYWEGNDHSTKTVNDGNWHHVTVVCDTNGYFSIYIDGVADTIVHQFGYGAANEGANNDAGTWHFTVGATLNHVFPAETGSGNSLAGEIDEVAVWPSVFSPTQIYNVWAYGVDNPPPSPFLAATMLGSKIVLSWAGFGWQLQQNTNLANPGGWNYVSSSNSSLSSFTPAGSSVFFRLAQ